MDDEQARELAHRMGTELNAILETFDPAFTDGDLPGSWLDMDGVKISDVQLDGFERLLVHGKECSVELTAMKCGHDGCAAKLFANMPGFEAFIPPLAVLAMVKELVMRRTMAAWQESETVNFE
jgi:hypothetical protein